MNKGLILFFVVLSAASAGFSQKPTRKPTHSATPRKTVSTRKPAPLPTPVDPAAENAKFDEALAVTSAPERAAALRSFLQDFPKSEHSAKAAEMLVTARAIAGDERLQAGDPAEGIASFRLAVEEAPVPIPERLFSEIVSKFPANLFYRDQRAAAIEIALAIEKKAAGDPKQLLNLAVFYLGIERGADAKRLAEASIALDPGSVAAYQTLGTADRVDFDLEGSANAYAKALELDPTSVASKRGLAEMKRALGKPDEAVALYREIAAANDADNAAHTGLALSLFDAGKKTEAEAEMSRALEQNPKDLGLLAGAAYWYAANDAGDKAVEYAQKAIETEPRYIWGHIAMARGLMSQKKPVEAERVLVLARQYGNFPTLEYEIASARMMAGFYREAAEELQKSFSIKDGMVRTKLGGRIVREEKNFGDLVAYERRASTFEPAAADSAENAAKLKLLLEMSGKLAADAPDETAVAALTDEFVNGDDKMKLHRQLYAASLLLQKNVALPKVLELVKSAIGNTDAGLDVSAPAAAVMASELYESRTVAFSRNEMIVVPDVPRQMLSAILRGRIEELTGWTLYQQKSYPEAIIRLRRAISVLPDKSAWWRSSMWRLGAALEADGKEKDALESYIQSYKTDRPSALKYSVVASLYKRVFGNTEGLELRVGPNPAAGIVASEPQRLPEKIARPTDPIPARLVDAPVRPEIPATKAVPAETAPAASEKAERDAEPNTDFKKHDDAKTDAVAESPAKTAPAEAAKVEVPVKIDKQVEQKTPIGETAATPADLATPKTETVVPPENQPDVKTTVADPPVKEAEISPPKTEVPPQSETKADAKPIEVSTKNTEPEPPRTAETTLPEVKTEPKTDPVETTVKALDKPAAKSTETTPVPDRGSNDVPVEKKTDPVDAPPAAETLKTTGSDPPSDPPKEPDEKPAKAKIDTASASPPQAATDVPARTGPASNTPTVIIHDPVLDAETKPKTDPAETPADSHPEKRPGAAPRGKPVVIIEDTLDLAKKPDAAKPKLFEPIIITVPHTATPSPAKKAEPEPAAAEPEKGQNLRTGKKGDDRPAESGAVRARVVDGKEISTGMECSFELSQQNVSLINNGGQLGVLLTITGEGDLSDITAASNSPKDVSVTAEPDIAGLPGRRFYVLKSISTAVGIYQVTFGSPCGKKEIVVRVR